MIDRRVELPDIHLQAVLRSGLIQESALNSPEGAVNAPSFNAGISIRSEGRDENGLQNQHDGVMDDPIRKERKPGDQPFFRFIHGEGMIGRGFIRMIPKHDVKGLQIPILVLHEFDHAWLTGLPFPGDDGRRLEVFHADDPAV